MRSPEAGYAWRRVVSAVLGAALGAVLGAVEPFDGDVLLARARSIESTDDIQRRHLQIANWYVSRDMREEAIPHFIESGDVAAAASVLNDVIERLIAAVGGFASLRSFVALKAIKRTTMVPIRA